MTPRRAAVAPRWAELDPRLRALWDAAVALARERASAAATDLVGVGGATVELERAAAELAPGLAWRPLPRDSLLGATVWALVPAGDPALVPDGDPAFVLLEPDTEGPLAASLVRHGEGLAAIYLKAPARPGPGRRTATGAGPFGPAVLLPGPRWGPHAVVVPPPGYHRPVIEAPDVTVRPAGPDDAEAIAALLTEEGYPTGPADVIARLGRLAAPDGAVLVADLDARPIGFVALRAVPRFEHDDVFVRILALVVDPGARERGVGHRLMEAAESFAAEHGAAFLEVTAGHHRPDARQLYEALGYDATLTAYLRKPR